MCDLQYIESLGAYILNIRNITIHRYSKEHYIVNVYTTKGNVMYNKCKDDEYVSKIIRYISDGYYIPIMCELWNTGYAHRIHRLRYPTQIERTLSLVARHVSYDLYAVYTLMKVSPFIYMAIRGYGYPQPNPDTTAVLKILSVNLYTDLELIITLRKVCKTFKACIDIKYPLLTHACICKSMGGINSMRGTTIFIKNVLCRYDDISKAIIKAHIEPSNNIVIKIRYLKELYLVIKGAQ